MTTRQNMCRHCCEYGHNRRTCPKLRESASKGNVWATLEVERLAAKGKHRVCSYCNNPGHNKQTCETLKDNRIQALCKNQEFRKRTIAFFKQMGIGLGTLLSLQFRDWTTGYTETEVLLMVDEIEWDNILYTNGLPSIKVNKMGEIDPKFNLTVTEDFFKMFDLGKLKVEVVADESNVGVAIPDKWYTGASNMSRAFHDWD